MIVYHGLTEIKKSGRFIFEEYMNFGKRFYITMFGNQEKKCDKFRNFE